MMRPDTLFAFFTGLPLGVAVFLMITGEWTFAILALSFSVLVFVCYGVWLNKDAPREQ